MRRQRVMSFCVALTLLTLGSGALPASAAPTPAAYQVIDLGHVEFFGLRASAIAQAINNKGQVGASSAFQAGAFGTLQGFVWRSGVGFTPCRNINNAADINSQGQIAGSIRIFTPGVFGPLMHAGICHLGQVSRDLGVLSGGQESDALGINDHTQVVGWASNAKNERHAVLWDKAGDLHDLGVLTDDGTSTATDINNLSQVVGFASTSSGQTHAFFWTERKGMQDLGVLPDATDSRATAVNNHGVVVGSSGGRAFLWDEARGMRALKSLPGAVVSVASDINDKNQVVGTASFSSDPNPPRRAFIWQAGLGMSELPLLPGTSSNQAFGINNHSQVVGTSLEPLHPVLWEPVKDAPE